MFSCEFIYSQNAASSHILFDLHMHLDVIILCVYITDITFILKIKKLFNKTFQFSPLWVGGLDKINQLARSVCLRGSGNS